MKHKTGLLAWAGLSWLDTCQSYLNRGDTVPHEAVRCAASRRRSNPALCTPESSSKYSSEQSQHGPELPFTQITSSLAGTQPAQPWFQRVDVRTFSSTETPGICVTLGLRQFWKCRFMYETSLTLMLSDG